MRSPRTLLIPLVVGLLAAAGLLAPPSAEAVPILMVTNNNGTSQSLVDFLQGEGHTVTRGRYHNALPTTAELDAHDLIIVARESNSGDYDDGSEAQQWNAIAKPMINMNMYLYRANRWGWMNGNSLPGLGSQTDYDAYPNPSHPFVDGLTTNLFDSPTSMTGASNSLPAGAEVVATLNGGASHGIFVLPAGTTMFNGKGVAGDVRVGFIRGNEGSWSNVSANGQQILLNIIDELTGTAIIPEPSTLLIWAGLLGLGLCGWRRRRR